MTTKRDPLAGGQSYAERLSKGRRKPDYHKRDAVLSVRVDDALAEWVKGQAEAQGLTVNAYLRLLLENLRSRS